MTFMIVHMYTTDHQKGVHSSYCSSSDIIITNKLQSYFWLQTQV